MTDEQNQQPTEEKEAPYGTQAERPARAIGFPCARCGNQMSYSPVHGKLYCSYCTSQKDIGSPLREAPEYLYFPDDDRYDAPIWENEEDRLITCASCGADTMISPAAVTATCPFCGSHYVTEPRPSDRLILPETMMPFRISEEAAVKTFSDWVKKRYLAPRKFRRGTHRPEPQGIYIPTWTFDAALDTDFNGFGGRRRVRHYTVRVNGKTQTRTRTVIDWYPVSGSRQLHFDDIPVIASKNIDRGLLEKVSPYSMKVLHVYDPAYLAGFLSERYSVSLSGGFAEARRIMECRMCAHIEASLGYDTYRGMQYRHRFHDVRFKHILLPLWIATYRYRGKLYPFMVNGETGRAAGRAPLSPLKIALLVFGGIALLGLLIFLFMMLGE